MCGALVVAVFLFPDEEEKKIIIAQWVSQHPQVELVFESLCVWAQDYLE